MSRIDNTSFLISQTSTEFTFCCRRLLFSGLNKTVIALLDYWPYFGASLFFENPLRKSLNSLVWAGTISLLATTSNYSFAYDFLTIIRLKPSSLLCTDLTITAAALTVQLP